jgi:hypothetical protein
MSAEDTASALVVVCAECGASREVRPTKTGLARTPAGWKHHLEAHYCRTCWERAYILRTISIPVASPVETSWEELREALKPAWRLSTAASNWMMTELYARDVRRHGEAKMPPMPRVYLYPEARERFPELPSQAVASLENACQRLYRAKRYDVVWTCSAALPNFRYPSPYPITSQSWQAALEGEAPVVSVRIGDRRFRLRLKSGDSFRRQYQAFRLMAGGGAVRGEASITGKGTAVMMSMAAWLPREQAGGQERSGTLFVVTRRDSMLVAINAKDERLWTYNADHLRRWQAEHSRQLRRWAEDHKYEQGKTPAFAARRAAAVVKYRDRMDSACHQIAAQLAGYASRRRFEMVNYDDRERGYCRQFPWSRLRLRLAEKLDEAGIPLEMEAAGGGEEPLELLVES